MDKGQKVQAFTELFDLINVYREERDVPIDELSTKVFFEKVEKCCEILDLDYSTFKNSFGLKDWKDIWGNK